jgi:hypothetical protein
VKVEDQVAIPRELYERLRTFIVDEKSGQIRLHFDKGVVRSWDVREHQAPDSGELARLFGAE